jgi:hypothetical protein
MGLGSELACILPTMGGRHRVHKRGGWSFAEAARFHSGCQSVTEVGAEIFSCNVLALV